MALEQEKSERKKSDEQKKKADPGPRFDPKLDRERGAVGLELGLMFGEADVGSGTATLNAMTGEVEGGNIGTAEHPLWGARGAAGMFDGKLDVPLNREETLRMILGSQVFSASGQVGIGHGGGAIGSASVMSGQVGLERRDAKSKNDSLFVLSGDVAAGGGGAFVGPCGDADEDGREMFCGEIGVKALGGAGVKVGTEDPRGLAEMCLAGGLIGARVGGPKGAAIGCGVGAGSHFVAGLAGYESVGEMADAGLDVLAKGGRWAADSAKDGWERVKQLWGTRGGQPGDKPTNDTELSRKKKIQVRRR